LLKCVQKITLIFVAIVPAQQAMAAQASRHEAKVDSIASKVKQGTYVWPSSQQIADRIMDDAELTARLQAMFRG